MEITKISPFYYNFTWSFHKFLPLKNFSLKKLVFSKFQFFLLFRWTKDLSDPNPHVFPLLLRKRNHDPPFIPKIQVFEFERVKLCNWFVSHGGY